MIPVLAAFLAAAVLQAEAPKHKLEFTAKGVPADEKSGTPPLIMVEGVTDYPDNTRLRVYLHVERIMHSDLRNGDVLARGGKFAYDMKLFRKRNMPGSYTLRVLFNPHLQGNREARKLPLHAETFHFKIGTDEERKKAVREVTERLVGQVNGIYDLAQVMEKEYLRRKGKPFDARSWDVFRRDLLDRSLKIEKEAYHDPDYLVLGLSGVADNEFEGFRDTVILLTKARGAMLSDPANKDFAAGARQIRTVLDTRYRRLLRVAKSRLPGPTLEACQALVRKAWGILDRAPGLSVEALKKAEREYKNGILALHRTVPPRFHEKVIGLTTAARPFFDALASGKNEDARKSLEELKRLLKELEEALKRAFADALSEEKQDSD